MRNSRGNNGFGEGEGGEGGGGEQWLQWWKWQGQGGGGVPGAGAEIHTEAGGGPMAEQMDILEATTACGEPTLEQRKIVRSKEWQKETIMYWP